MKVNILGIGIDRAGFNEVLETALALAKETGNYITTVNSEFIIEARKDSGFREILNNSSLAIPDSWGVVWASKILAKPVGGRVSGTDLMQELVKSAAKSNLIVGLLGAREGVAQKAKERLLDCYSGLKVLIALPGNPNESADNSMRKVLQKAGRIDILFVAYGAPKQEKWISRNIKHINVGVAIGVGGSFDYIVGVQKRAPALLRKIGLEWLWRLITQPWRVGRMMALPKFAVLVWLQKFNIINP